MAHSDEDRNDFLRKRGFSKAETGKIIETVMREEGRPSSKRFVRRLASARRRASST
ncbi:hypothetical protein [Celeribacter baekdonensis]|uniref:hypothetical protein n=1 Tax=Celeribacter baekdonensis TaxID=875171 RepID=UPI0020C7562E|nr:hypothetical protein [Celeribacter baekdonensis]